MNYNFPKKVKRLSTIFFLVALLLGILAPTKPAMAEISNDRTALLISFEQGADVDKIVDSLGGKILEEIPQLQTYKVQLTQNRIVDAYMNSGIVSIEEDAKAKLSYIPNDTLFPSQTYLTKIKVPEAWNTNTGSPSITVAIVDTGIDYLHEDLINSFWHDSYGHIGYDFVNEDYDPMDDHSHGTTVAGIIAAGINNGKGIAGIANVKLMVIKSMLPNGEGYVSDIAQGIIYAADNGARVINLSLGLPDYSLTLDNAVSYAYAKGAVVVAATGNKGALSIDTPARNPLAIGVGALNANDAHATFSNSGEGTVISAPGEGILSAYWSSTDPYTGYRNNNGTSFAAPQVTGAIALLLSQDPSLTPDQLKKRIALSAKKLPGMLGNYDIYYGYGELDALSAITYDRTGPTITLSGYRSTNIGAFYLKGSAEDGKGSGTLLPDTPISNIQSVRYSLDGSVTWEELLNATAQKAIFNTSIPLASIQNDTIAIEAYDTAGNRTVGYYRPSQTTDVPQNTNYQASAYRATYVEQGPYPALLPGQKTAMTLSMKNTGTAIWTREKVHLGTSRTQDRSSVFADSSWLAPNRIAMKEPFVSPGETAHFEFTVTAPAREGSYREYFALVAEQVTWFSVETGIYWRIDVAKASYHAAYVGQSPYVTISRGGTSIFWVEYKNIGTQTWDSNIVKLGTSRKEDRNSVFYNTTAGSGWLSPNRVIMSKKTVAPGETARFTFIAQAPQTPGTYYEYFRPVAEYVTWMEDVGMYWEISVI